MDEAGEIELYRWIGDRFGADSAHSAAAIERLGPAVTGFLDEGTAVLDLGCGGGAWSFFVEDLGAAVTGIDAAPRMIAAARAEAAARGSEARFVVADMASHDLGESEYDAAVLMGNTLADIPPEAFCRVAADLHRALRPGGRFILYYLDGVKYFERERLLETGVEQEHPERVTWRYKGYNPDWGAWVVTYANETTGQQFDYASYLYPTPLVRALLAPHFRLGATERFGDANLDVFVRREPEVS